MAKAGTFSKKRFSAPESESTATLDPVSPTLPAAAAFPAGPSATASSTGPRGRGSVVKKPSGFGTAVSADVSYTGPGLADVTSALEMKSPLVCDVEPKPKPGAALFEYAGRGTPPPRTSRRRAPPPPPRRCRRPSAAGGAATGATPAAAARVSCHAAAGDFCGATCRNWPGGAGGASLTPPGSAPALLDSRVTGRDGSCP